MNKITTNNKLQLDKLYLHKEHIKKLFRVERSSLPINKTKNVLYSNELIYFKFKGALIQLCSSLACWAIGWGERQLFPPTKLPLSYSLTSLTFRWILSYFWLTELLQFPKLDRTLEKEEILFYSMIGKLERSTRDNFLICSLWRYSLSGCNLLFVVILFNFR